MYSKLHLGISFRNLGFSLYLQDSDIHEGEAEDKTLSVTLITAVKLTLESNYDKGWIRDGVRVLAP